MKVSARFLFLSRHHRPGLNLHEHFLQIDSDSSEQCRWPRMRPQIRLEFLEETVHLVTHIEDVFAPWQIIPEHDDMLERGIHHLQLILDVFEALAGLLLNVHRHYFALAGAFLLGSSARSIFKGVASGLAGQEQNIHVAFRLEATTPVHLFLVVVWPERAPVILNFSFLRELHCLRISRHTASPLTSSLPHVHSHTSAFSPHSN